MIGIFMLAVAGLTSAVAYLLGAHPLGLAPARLGAALGKMLETVGAILIFLVADLLVAAVIVVALRGVTDMFVSIYMADDTTWLGLALVQGLVFQAWRQVSAVRALEQRGHLG